MSLRIAIETGEALRALGAQKASILPALEAATADASREMQEAGTRVFMRGLKGFRPRPYGRMLTEGLRIAGPHRARRGKIRFFASLWHPLVNIFENFKARPRVRILSAVRKEYRDSVARRTLDEAIKDS